MHLGYVRCGRALAAAHHAHASSSHSFEDTGSRPPSFIGAAVFCRPSSRAVLCAVISGLCCAAASPQPAAGSLIHPVPLHATNRRSGRADGNPRVTTSCMYRMPSCMFTHDEWVRIDADRHTRGRADWKRVTWQTGRPGRRAYGSPANECAGEKNGSVLSAVTGEPRGRERCTKRYCMSYPAGRPGH